MSTTSVFVATTLLSSLLSQTLTSLLPPLFIVQISNMDNIGDVKIWNPFALGYTSLYAACFAEVHIHHKISCLVKVKQSMYLVIYIYLSSRVIFESSTSLGGPFDPC